MVARADESRLRFLDMTEPSRPVGQLSSCFRQAVHGTSIAKLRKVPGGFACGPAGATRKRQRSIRRPRPRHLPAKAEGDEPQVKVSQVKVDIAGRRRDTHRRPGSPGLRP
jgi:hypothetical protein